MSSSEYNFDARLRAVEERTKSNLHDPRLWVRSFTVLGHTAFANIIIWFILGVVFGVVGFVGFVGVR